MDVFLFMNFFPYKNAEPFFFSEFEFTKQYADSITVFTLYGKPEERKIDPTDSVAFLKPVLASSEDKKKIFSGGIFNTAGISFHLKELFSKRIFLNPKKLYWFFVSTLITRISLSSSSLKEIKEKIEQAENPVLYFYWGNNLSWMIPYLKKRIKNKNLKIIVRLHGSDLYESTTADYAPLREPVFSAAHLIATVSEYGKNYLTEKYPEFQNKIICSRLGIFDNGLNPLHQENEYRIISVSNMIPLKRIDLIFDALQQTTSRIVWHHFGTGVLEASLKELIKSKRENLDIHFHGFVDNKTLMDFYKTYSLNLFLNVSSSEGLPVSIMEALSYGIPVIATNVGGTSELVDENTGKLIDKDFDTLELAGDIENLLHAAPERTNKLRENARNIFEEKVSASKNYTSFYERIKHLD